MSEAKQAPEAFVGVALGVCERCRGLMARASDKPRAAVCADCRLAAAEADRDRLLAAAVKAVAVVGCVALQRPLPDDLDLGAVEDELLAAINGR